AESRPTTIRDAFWAAVQGDHPDVLLLRFLRARKWKVDDALDMLLACLRWRLDEEIDWLVWVGESELNYALMQSGIGAIHKMDRLGQPILYIPVRLNDPRAQPADQMVEYTIYLMEVSRILLHPPVEKVCLVFDTTDMSISNMDWTFFKTFLHYLEHYYPECLGLVLIYNASWVFNSLWKLIRPLLDPVVASKVQFVNSAAELQKFIDPENLPIEYGGNDAFKYKYVLPQPDENKAMFDEDGRKHAAEARSEACNEFEAVTRRWVGIDSAAEDLAKDLDNSSRQKAADALVEASKGLDKYVRARTLYHRTRAIDDKGR
ncbi:CRAL-TRIO domain-containing protein, partial [Coemansia spiralis]